MMVFGLVAIFNIPATQDDLFFLLIISNRVCHQHKSISTPTDGGDMVNELPKYGEWAATISW